MRAIDFFPLSGSTVGFDRLFSVLDNVREAEASSAYTPYNVELVGDNAYRIAVAVAGFSEDDLSIEIKNNILTIKGTKSDQEASEEVEILFRGIASRSFELRFQLADHLEIKNANLNQGLLNIELLREIPESMKPRKIEISRGNQTKKIEAKIDKNAA